VAGGKARMLTNSIGLSNISLMVDSNRRTLIFYARRYSAEMGRAVESVLNPDRKPTLEEVERLYKLLKRDGGKHLSPDVYMALIEALRAEGLAHERPS